MKKIMICLLILVVFPFLISAATPESKGVNVAFDIPSLVSTVNITFSNKAIRSGFKAYESLTEAQKVTAIELSVAVDSGALRGINNDVYISYQVYSDDVVDIIIKPSGPLKMKNSENKLINWQVSCVGKDNLFAGSLEVNTGETEYTQNPSFIAYTSNIGKAGLSGSKQLQIRTQSLMTVEVGDYEAQLIANVKVR